MKRNDIPTDNIAEIWKMKQDIRKHEEKQIIEDHREQQKSNKQDKSNT